MPDVFRSRWQATLARRARERAIVDTATGRELTFAGVDNAARARAGEPGWAGLASRLVVLHRVNSAEWLIDFLALRLAGATVVPVDAETPRAAVEKLATTIRAEAIVDAEGLRRVAGIRPRRARADLFLGKLTSGSTGAPKLFLFTVAQMLADADAIVAGMGLADTDVNLGGLPFAHSYALGNLIVPLFAHGLPVVVASSHFPGVIASEIEKHGATVLPTVPAIIGALARSEVPPAKLRSLRRVISAGARLTPEDARAFALKFGARVHNFYGSSETGGVAYDASGEAAASGDRVGRPLPGVSVARGRDGRLVVSGPAVRTVGSVARDERGYGRHRMADLGEVDAEGAVRLLGRAASLIKIGGRRVAPGEVEAALRALPGVREAFVAAVPGPAGEPRLAALVAGDDLDPRALRGALRATLPAWKIPAHPVVVSAFPLTPRGKPDRAAMLRRLSAESGGGAPGAGA